MRWHQRILSPWLRSLAAFALLVFIAAQAACFIHCNFGGRHGDSGDQPSCHGSAAAAKPTHGEHDAPAPAPTATCSTLKTMLAEAGAPIIIASQVHTLYVVASFSFAQDATEARPEAAFHRQNWTRDWVFRPEVCLGPALRSLAPPFLG